ncbi:MAG: MazG nucleotide pyrophosphohydrolase domain-containing protein [Promethearchaeota archaeon]|jgi:NTP pyrophosphatase (non-canonical NTP hydrolase)
MKISDFQDLIKKLYIERDQRRGIHKTFIWLIEEIGELANLLRKRKIDKNNVTEEISDIIAWTTSLANLLDIDIESALFMKYPNMCIKCKSNPCICGK